MGPAGAAAAAIGSAAAAAGGTPAGAGGSAPTAAGAAGASGAPTAAGAGAAGDTNAALVAPSAGTASSAVTACPGVSTPIGTQGTCASTGNATVTGSTDATALINNQVSSVVTGGGTGATSAQNTSVNNVSSTGTALGQTGVSVAGGVPTTVAGAPIAELGTGQTNAASGAAQAAGVSSQNVVRNSSVAAVQVSGPSSAPVKVQSSHVVNVGNVGSATAASGTAVALPVATPAAADIVAPVPAAAISPETSVGGLAIQNNVTGQTSSTTTLPGATAPSAPVVVSQVQQVAVTSGSAATAGSASVAAGGSSTAATGSVTNATGSVTNATGSVTNSASSATNITNAASSTTNAVGSTTNAAGTVTNGAGSVTNAASGAASAVGVSAHNLVTTSANVNVQVAGQNFAPITVMIQMLTNILNHGVASATSGTAAATGTQLVGPAGANVGTVRQPIAAGANATSGNASALGSSVTNQASLASSAVVHVAGNNYDPINLFLGMFITLTNWGFGSATSGSAQTISGQGVASVNAAGATTGSASAIGLQAMNDVDLQANAQVQIDGSNFAPITVWVEMQTTIDNTGQAAAQSGDSLAVGHTDPRASGTGTSSAAPETGATGAAPGTGAPAASARPATATPTPLPAAGVRLSGSVEMSSPSGAHGSSLLRASTNVDQAAAPPAQAVAQPNAAPAAVAAPGIHAWSGDAACLGTSTELAAANRQLSQVASQGGPGRGPSNASLYAISTQHDVSCQAGFAGANATPTPRPTPTPAPDTNRANRASLANDRTQPLLQPSAHPADDTSARTTGPTRHTGSSGSPKSHSTIQSNGLFGSIVGIALEDAWPSPDGPLMPVQTRRVIRGAASGGEVGRSANGFGQADDVPLPNQIIPGGPPLPDQQIIARATRGAAPSSRPPARRGSSAAMSEAMAEDSVAQPETEDQPAPDSPQTGVLGIFVPLGPTADWPQAEPVPVPELVIRPHADSVADGALPVDPLAAAVAALGAVVLAASTARERRARVWLQKIRRTGAALAATVKLHARAVARIGLGVLRIW